VLSGCLGFYTQGTSEVNSISAKTQTAISIGELINETPLVVGNNLPTPGQNAHPTATYTTTPARNCEDRAELIDETIPDQSVISPEQPFEKKWMLQNSGSCTWNQEYDLIFVGGNQLGGLSSSPLNQTISPNEAFEMVLKLISPPVPGYYESFWKLQNDQGNQFGIGYNADIPLWIKIHSGNREVLGGALDLGKPDWRDTFDEDRKNIYLGTNSITNYDIRDGNLEITAFKPIGDVWQIANNHMLFNIYFEMIVSTGEICTGKDGYGVLIRAPDQPDGVIDSGYVFSFSCDGMYRIYMMDNGEYNSIQLWTETENIKPGPNQMNRLGVRAEGNKFQFYANGELLTEFFNSRYSSGLFGIMIRSETTNNFKILVDEIGYWRISK
jgi:hypothetical protein